MEPHAVTYNEVGIVISSKTVICEAHDGSTRIIILCSFDRPERLRKGTFLATSNTQMKTQILPRV